MSPEQFDGVVFALLASGRSLEQFEGAIFALLASGRSPEQFEGVVFALLASGRSPEQFEGVVFALSNAITIPVLSLRLPNLIDEAGKLRRMAILLPM